MVEDVCIGDSVDCRVHGNHKEDDGGDVFESGGMSMRRGGQQDGTYRVVIRGIIAPLVMVSTRRRKGIIDNTLWLDEKGINQCTTRL